MKIVFCIPDLGCGGAERVVSIMANDWSRAHSVAIVTLTPKSRDFYRFDPSIDRRCIDNGKAGWFRFYSKLRVVFAFRGIFDDIRPDFVVSFLPKTNILVLLATLFSKYRVIACERNIINDPSIDARQSVLRGILYRRAYKITVQHREIYDELLATYPRLRPDRVRITPNPVKKFAFERMEDPQTLFPDYRTGDAILVGVGRFTATKAFKDLIRALSLVHDKDATIRLIIFGEGAEFESCRALVRDLSLDGFVALPGPAANINGWFAASDLFVTTTRHEGFPNALAEALSAGLPAVAFKAPSLAVLVRDGENGYLVPNRDVGALADRIVSILHDDALYGRLSNSAATISDAYSPERVNEIWLNEVLS